MGDLTPLTDAQLAAIAERADGPYPHRLGDYAFEADRDRRSLLRHITASAARLAEAEQEIALLTDERAQARELSTMARERLAETSKELAAAQATIEQRVATIHGLSKTIDGHEAEVEDLAQRCDKATAQLATAQAPIARLTTLLEYTRLALSHPSVECLLVGEAKEQIDNLYDAINEALAPPAPEAVDAR